MARYRAKHPDFADGLENHIPEGLAVFSLPEVNRKRMRRSNGIERPIQQELKRRTAKVNVFTNIVSLERRSTAALVKIGEKWAPKTEAYIKSEGHEAKIRK